VRTFGAVRTVRAVRAVGAVRIVKAVRTFGAVRAVGAIRTERAAIWSSRKKVLGVLCTVVRKHGGKNWIFAICCGFLY
jgi:hypothetical protein